mmetsp:Transcript_86679/g.248687  ORF Transcript_86679/g.248687 Transcript_86679/m.248687 type:complete len:210 (-) Transcript_86679:222-851(-)
MLHAEFLQHFPNQRCARAHKCQGRAPKSSTKFLHPATKSDKHWSCQPYRSKMKSARRWCSRILHAGMLDKPLATAAPPPQIDLASASGGARLHCRWQHSPERFSRSKSVRWRHPNDSGHTAVPRQNSSTQSVSRRQRRRVLHKALRREPPSGIPLHAKQHDPYPQVPGPRCPRSTERRCAPNEAPQPDKQDLQPTPQHRHNPSATIVSL